jgi:zona occludens toxin
MIYLTTGANGSGKTLNTLELVRAKQVKEGRTVYYDGFDMKPEKALEFGWLKCDPTKWQDLPDGAIVVWDECQRTGHLEALGSGAKIPEFINMLGEHRKRGFDFFLISQHPLNVHKFVLRLIGSPGWHRHLKRAFGADMVSVLEWSAVATNCEKAGAGKSAKVSMVAFPKHVYGWYDSAVLHTGKKQIPFKVYLLGVLAVVIPVLAWLAVGQVANIGKKPGAASSAAAPVATSTGAPADKPDYLASYVPRIPGLPHTAPRYDEVTKPTTAPMPAACVQMGKRCECYTQQGTALQTTPEICQQIVKGGYFQEWGAAPAVGVGATPAPAASVPGSAARSGMFGAPAEALPGAVRAAAVRDGEALASMRGAARATY